MKFYEAYNNLYKSDVTDYEDKISWSDVSTIEFNVYQYDKDDINFQDEGEPIQSFTANTPSQFIRAQNKAITVANKIASTDNTPCSVVLIGYDENYDSIDEYWDTIYYVKPKISTKTNNKTQLKKLPKSATAVYKDNVLNDIHNEFNLFGQQESVSCRQGFYNGVNMFEDVGYYIEFYPDVSSLRQFIDSFVGSGDFIFKIWDILQTNAQNLGQLYGNYIYTEERPPKIYLDIVENTKRGTIVYDRNWNPRNISEWDTIYEIFDTLGRFEYDMMGDKGKLSHGGEMISKYTDFKNVVEEGPDGNVYVVAYNKIDEVPYWVPIREVRLSFSSYDFTLVKASNTTENLKLRIKEF
jgi:hypothetical protein